MPRLAHIPVTILRVPMFPMRQWDTAPSPVLPLRGALGMHYRAVVGCECRNKAHRPGCLVAEWYNPAQDGRDCARPLALHTIGPRHVGPRRPWMAVLTLLGTVPHPEALLAALQATASGGLGRDRIVHRIGLITITGADTVVRLVDGPGAWPAPGRLSGHIKAGGGKRCRLQFTTPLQWQRDQPMGLRPDFPTLFRAAILRVRAVERMLKLRGDARWPDPGERVWIESERLVEGGWSRYSQRQGRHLSLAGPVGSIELAGDLPPYADLLAAMAVLQLGRGTSAGLGAVRLDWDPT